MTTPGDLQSTFGGIDIYLFDQLLRGRIVPGQRIFDAGCGSGRNLVYLLQHGFDVSAVDADPAAIAQVRHLAAQLSPGTPADRFRTESLDASSFPDACADVVISSAVLHFARTDAEFNAMLDGSWRLLAPGGLFFCRLASSIGVESLVTPSAYQSRRCRLPDGSDRYLVDESFLLERTLRLNGRLVDPLKTTVVQNQRAMTTWVVRKA
jgi:SAM-dependent methyltransferase